ncbi:MAG TPA: UDP-N-acetylmuramate--L-alanine ligase, partial [Terriglobia bacterium]|nr:UDP-N-acetylmuramate--L-alanine ligase [Terriglobia bacterium]
NIHGAEVVVISSAVPNENPEILEAQRLQVPIIPRAEMLAELMRLKFSVAVAGAHGKTTTTSMIALMLTEAGLDPTAVIGGRLDVFGSSARLGKGDLMVAEADESDRSFLLLLPSIAVVTNIDREHLDHYHSLDEIIDAFVSFMNKTPFYGAVIACADSPWGETIEAIRPRLRRRLVTYGLEPGANITAANVHPDGRGTSFDVLDAGRRLLHLTLAVPGRHNVQNALAAVGVGLELGLTGDEIRRGLEQFHGADRRFEVKAEAEGVTVVDDYGHHPTEIRATLDAAQARGARRIWAIFQPHRYTRTQFLMDDFAGAFAGAERVYVLDIYPASEKPIPGITSERLVERMHQMGCSAARYAASEDDLIRKVLAEVEPGVLLLTIGAGSVWRISEAVAKGLQRQLAVPHP